jgi:GNAT superfamily N-acetyltransferase
MVRRCYESDFDVIRAIINDGAEAYKGLIPADCWTEPYMAAEKLQREMDDGVVFWGYERSGKLVAAMGIQETHEVTLIRHAYVRTASQNQGIGGQLLSHLLELARGPVLIGAWRDAALAIRFYEKYGFELVDPQEKDRLLKQFWTVPERQIETSVVLANLTWRLQPRC